MNYWRIVLRNDNVEERAYLLIEEGALGVEIISDHELACFLEGDDWRLFQKRVADLGFSWVVAEKVPDINWVQKSTTFLQPLKIGGLQIVPVAEGCLSGEVQQSTEMTIKIITGCGFGTGHHATTAMVIELLQQPLIASSKPRRFLDLGTGSGILALAAAALYAGEIVAVDNDPMAVANATDNLRLNGQEKRVKIQLGELDQAQGSFDIIMANLYLNILVEQQQRLSTYLTSGGFLIISGYLGDQQSAIKEAFGSAAWRFEKELSKDNWCAALLQRL